MLRTSVFLFIAFLSFSCSKEPSQVDLLILNATVIDIESGSVTPDQLIAISADTIFAVDKSSLLNNYFSEESIDIGGKFVMPGLWDNHVHFRGGAQLIDQNRELLPLYLAFGVTTVRDGGGDITPAIQQWQKEIKSGDLDGPTIFTSGPKLDGDDPAWEGSLEVTDTESTLSALDSLEAIGADYVKVYDGNLTAESYYEIIKETERRGLEVTGHMPLNADLMTAVEHGLDGTEHLYYVLKAASAKKDSLSAIHNGYAMITPLMETFDEEYAKTVYSELARHNFYVTPTLHIGKTLAELLITDHTSDSLLSYIATQITETYQRRLNSARRGGQAYTEARSVWVDHFSSMVKPMHDAGIHLLAGSDSGPFNSFTYPGESIHKELELLVDAGLSPAEALRTSVINGPMFFGLEDHYGAVRKGRVADLLILEDNPLESVTNTQSVYAVVSDGRWYSPKTLADLMDSVRQ